MKNLIQKEWQSFMEQAVNPLASPEQVVDAKIFFFGGAAALFFLIGRQWPKDWNTDDVMQEIKRELEAYNKKMEAKDFN